MGFWDWNLQTGKITCSDNLERLYGLLPTPDEATRETLIARVHPEDRDLVYQTSQRSFESSPDSTIEFRVIWPDGSIHWLESKCQVFYDDRGKPVRQIGIGLDICDRKQAETQIKASLREKEVLLQEIHHRVKNNLQVISSLLDLQSLSIDEPATQELFRESQNRIRSMALVHEKLYQSKDCARINFAEYIENLINYLFRAYGVSDRDIALKLEIDNKVSVNIDTAIPCGLIINELVSNALKHAFPDGKIGQIGIALHSDESHHFSLMVRDNGKGLPTNFEFKSIKSLGLQLVNVLANQLKGKVELDRRVGTEFRITFSEISR
jgi:PAS domain S-box-containing protein